MALDWYPVPTAATMGPDWWALPAAARGNWLSLMTYCAQNETGGVIAGAKRWEARRWLQAAGMDRDELAAVLEAGLALWHGDDLVVKFYDPAAEEKARKRSESASIPAEKRWRTARERAAGNASA